ncbi:NusA antitermination factor [Eubacterium ruminantium]|uniref:Transcription termination/antitermination protein NusA n=1 Tax=Eubacterium ruminantium TaxID=42322 RepID=A0A1T4MFB0_9FIRM|nr:transcription termination factor NusA [Eubacterium ruminantium]SCW47599.1 NusA antitermination factor [Eubacterium ruminantium]SDM55485.1 NusA antitermination factor [Eubacterium ruminantium]SJZ65468.1 NusA antitermination factor [Eubacterium ruminantium]
MSEIIDALDQLEKEKGISKEVLMEAIEKSVYSACEKDFGKNTEYEVRMDRESGKIQVFANKTVVDVIYDTHREMTLEEARHIDPNAEIDDEIRVEVTTKDFGRIAAQKARSIIVQAIKEGERSAVFDYFASKEKDIITGVVQKVNDRGLTISLDEKTETILGEQEMIEGENYKVGDRIKLYIVEVKKNPKGFKIVVSRTHPDLVKRLFEREITEVSDGTVEIKSISREAGSRTKIAVNSTDENVDAVGACVGMNGTRVNNIVEDLKGEKIDIIEWSEDPAVFIEHALSPAKVVSVKLIDGEKAAKVVVPDYQLSLAIGKEGQNARLAARLTGYKIDIKSESQAKELDDYDYDEDGYNDEYTDDEYDDYEDDKYTDEEYSDEEYSDEEYSDEEYSDEEYDEEYDEESTDNSEDNE